MAEIDRSEEYDCQYFGFTTSSAVTGIKGMLNELMDTALESMCSKMERIYNKDDINKAKSIFSASFRHALDMKTEEMNRKMKLFFSVKENVLLEEDEHQEKQFTPEFEEQKKNDMQQAIHQYKSYVAMKNKLEDIFNELNDYEKSVEYMEKCLKVAGTLNEELTEVAKNMKEVDHLISKFDAIMTGEVNNLSDGSEKMDLDDKNTFKDE